MIGVGFTGSSSAPTCAVGIRAATTFKNSPIPIGINKNQRFKLVGATSSPDGQSTKDFTLKGKFTSGKKASYSMKLQGCGPKTTGRLTYAER